MMPILGFILLPSTPWALKLPRVGRISARHVLHRNPVISRERVDGPSSVEPPDTRVLLAAKRTERQIVDRLIVDVSHAGFDASCESQPSLEVTREYGARQSIRCVVRQLQRVLLIGGPNQRRHGAEDLVTRERVVVGDIGEYVRREHPSFG